jgi:D-glycero-D-manno-heptose 1,7-bisphosphate phosphatase
MALENAAQVKKALVLDLDQTVRYNKDDPDGFLNGPETLAVYPDVAPVLQKYARDDYIIIGVTNQGGVAHGHKSLDDALEENDRTQDLLKRENGEPLFHILLLCPFMRGGKLEPFGQRSLLRKPQIGMLALAEHYLFVKASTMIDWDLSIMVGDRDEDRELAQRAGVHFVPAHVFFGRE